MLIASIKPEQVEDLNMVLDHEVNVVESNKLVSSPFRQRSRQDEVCNHRLPLSNRWTLKTCCLFVFFLPLLLSIVPIFTITDNFDPAVVTNQRVLICGASGGIGEEMVYKYAVLGAHIGLVARRKTQLERVAKEAMAEDHGIELEIKDDIYHLLEDDLEESKNDNSKLQQARIIKLTDIKLTEVIGKGAFGEVFKGRWRGIDVAVKKMFPENMAQAQKQCCSNSNCAGFSFMNGAGYWKKNANCGITKAKDFSGYTRTDVINNVIEIYNINRYKWRIKRNGYY